MDAIEFRNKLWQMVQLTNLCIEQGTRPILEDSGLTMLQARVLMEVERGEKVTVGNLAQKLELAKGNASSMCKKLEQQGFLERSRDINDERYVLLILTEQGCRVLKEIKSRLEKKYNPVIEAMSDEEMRCVLKSMGILNGILQEIKNTTTGAKEL